ncbi:MAG: ScnB [Acidimicrobiales bacterium]
MSGGGQVGTGGYEVLTDAMKPVRHERSLALTDRDRQAAPWESSMQATCDCLLWRGALDSLERRQAEDELGETVYAEFPSHARSALVSAHLLMERGIITQDELRAKMAEVRSRLVES